MKVLFLTPYPDDSAPSQRFRFELYYEVLLQAGIAYEHRSFWDQQGWTKLYEKGSRISKVIALVKGFARRKWLMFNLKSYDIIFIHREVAPIGPPIFEWYIAKVLMKRIIYDFDDAIWLPNTSEQNSIVGQLKWQNKVSTICRWSWKVSAGNDYLADYARQYCEQVKISRTVVNTDVHQPINNQLLTTNQPLIIGWTGSHSTLKYLQLLVPMLQRLELKFDFTFLVIADQDPQLPLRSYSFIKWSKKTEVENLNQLDIGLMPLENDQWARGKCGFKAIQYGAVGIPALVSPIGVNNEIVDHGVSGYHCHSEEDWESSISRLIEDQELRQSMGQAGRERIVRHYSVESQKEYFLSLFSQ